MSEVENKPTVAEDAPVETSTAPAESTPAAEPTTATEAAPVTTDATEAPATTSEEAPAAPPKDDVAQGEAKVEATPASEGILGFKHPPFPKTLRYSKTFFWFSEEPIKAGGLATYLRETKAEVAQPNAAWAQETGKGLLFYAKRSEDKTHPTGIINLSDVTDVTKEGYKDFSFKVKGAKYLFSPEDSKQQASWIVALEKEVKEAHEIKESVISSEGYKNQLEKHTKPATLVAPAAVAAKPTETKTTPAEEKKEEKKEQKEEDKGKARSQSRGNKRQSIFGSLLNKKEELKEKQEVKKEEKAEAKEEKKEEKEEKEETKEEPATGESSTAKETEAAAAAAGVAAVAGEETKAEEKKPEDTLPAAHSAATEAPATTTERPGVEKQKKRGSVFGSFFGKKDVTSPTTEKSAEEAAAPAVPAKDDVPPVSETAPKIEEPVAAAPIDTAAVTAPVDTGADTTATTTAEPTSATKETKPETTQQKGGLIGFLKKTEAKLEPKKDHKKAETPATTAESTETPTAATPATDGDATPAETTTADTTPKEKRRTSIFGTLSGTIKKRTGRSSSKAPAEEKKTEETPAATTATEETAPAAETTETKPEETAAPVTNGTSAEAKEANIGDVPASAVHTAPEVEATA